MKPPGPLVALKKTFRRKSGDFTLDLQFQAPAGVTILYGPSGSGKTSLLRAIAGISDPDEGKICLGDQVFFDSHLKISLPIRLRRVGYVFQNGALFPHLTAQANVAYGMSSTTDKPRRSLELLALLGIEYTAKQYPSEMSGGESQRVALARALASQPALMLLDEPISALDPASRALVLEKIRLAHETTGIPFLYVTHQLAEAHELGTHALLLENGRLVGEGPPREVLVG